MDRKITVFHIVFCIFILIIVFSIHKEFENYKIEIETEQECYEFLKNASYESSKECYYNIWNKYKKIGYLYNYALSLYVLKDYDNAKKELEYILSNEKEDEKTIELANNLKKDIDLELLKIEEANRHDYGNYYYALSRTAMWENPKDVKVYINPTEDFYFTFKKAVEMWNDALIGTIHLRLIDNEQEANITIKMVDAISQDCSKEDTTIGCTSYGQIIHYYTNPNKHYFYKTVPIEILRRHPILMSEFNQDEILSTTLHELGHALGIMDHSDSINDLMYYNTESYQHINPGISNRDINTIRRIYGNIN